MSSRTIRVVSRTLAVSKRFNDTNDAWGTMARRTIIIVLVLAMNIGCASLGGQPMPPPMSQLEIREMQTRTFSGVKSTEVMKALLNVLQDDGFVVRNAVIELGLLSATKEIDVSDSGEAILNSVLFGSEARWNKNSIIESTANVTQTGRDAKVRVTFQIKTMTNRGEVADVRAVSDAKYYQDFFSKVDKGIFIQNEGL